MTARLDCSRPGDADLDLYAPIVPPPKLAIADRVKVVLALLGVALIPVLAAIGLFVALHAGEHRRAMPVPLVLRGSLAPEGDFAKLEMPEDRP